MKRKKKSLLKKRKKLKKKVLKKKVPGMFISEDDMKEKERFENELNSEASPDNIHYEDIEDALIKKQANPFNEDELDIMEIEIEESSSDDLDKIDDMEECPKCGDDLRYCDCKKEKKEEE